MKPTTRSKTTKTTKTAKTESPAIIATEAVLDESQRLQQIAMAAYLKAESRGFAPGGELDDWLVAEKEFDVAGGLTRMVI